jgi:hypothetical protein
MSFTLDHSSDFTLSCPVCKNVGSDAIPTRVRFFWGWISDEIGPISHLAASIASCKSHELEIIDVSQFAFPRGSRSYGQLIEASEGIKNIPYKKIQNFGPWSRMLRYGRDVASPFIEEGIETDLTSIFRGEPIWPLNLGRKFGRLLFRTNAQALIAEIRKMEVAVKEIWIIENGRYSHQRVLLEYAISAGHTVLFTEATMFFEGMYYLRNYSPHSRSIMQKSFADWISNQKNSTSEIRESEAWFDLRFLGKSSTNIFSSRFSKPYDAITREKPLVSFFPSSADEFDAFGEEWMLFGFNNQFEGFELLADFFVRNGFATVLRLHPHLMEKSAIDIARDLESARVMMTKFGTDVIFPGDSVNTYDLLQKSSVVVVAHSTVGLEAMYQNKKVISVGSTYYDSSPGLFTFSSDKDFAAVERFLSIASEPRALKNFATEYMIYQRNMDFIYERNPVKPSSIRKMLISALKFDNLFYFTMYHSQIAFSNLLRPIFIRWYKFVYSLLR